MDIDQLLALTGRFSSIWQLVLYVVGTIIASSIVIEISPIKINPLKKFIELISKNFKAWFKDIIDDSLDKSLESVKEENKKRDEAILKMDGAIETLTEKVDQITERMDTNEARAQQNHISLIRNSVLTFANNLRSGVDASQESFDNILDQIDEYNSWHNADDERRKQNGKMLLSIEFINAEYKRRFNHTPNES